jgi:hypothetical protein
MFQWVTECPRTGTAGDSEHCQRHTESRVWHSELSLHHGSPALFPFPDVQVYSVRIQDTEGHKVTAYMGTVSKFPSYQTRVTVNT